LSKLNLGLDCLVTTGKREFETNLDYMAKVHFMEGEVDAVDEETFNQQVEILRLRVDKTAATPAAANR